MFFFKNIAGIKYLLGNILFYIPWMVHETNTYTNVATIGLKLQEHVSGEEKV